VNFSLERFSRRQIERSEDRKTVLRAFRRSEEGVETPRSVNRHYATVIRFGTRFHGLKPMARRGTVATRQPGIRRYRGEYASSVGVVWVMVRFRPKIPPCVESAPSADIPPRDYGMAIRKSASRSDGPTHSRGFQSTEPVARADVRRVASPDGPGDFNPRIGERKKCGRESERRTSNVQLSIKSLNDSSAMSH